MSFNITTLVENTVFMGPKRLKGEHGLSFLIEKDGHKLLFDTGQTGIFAENAAILGVNPAEISTVVLSHGHYDHTGGLSVLLDMVPDRNNFV